MLKEFQLRDDRGSVNLIELENRRSSDPTGDPLGGSANIIGSDDHGPHPTTGDASLDFRP